MKRVIILLLFISVAISVKAQRVTREYNNVSLSEALRQLNEQTEKYTISFLYNELEDFHITTSVHHKNVPDAIRQMIGFYPIRMTIEDREIIVECPQKTAPRYKGTIIDEQGQPIAYANIALLSPQDSTLITGGVSNESGLFVIPCTESPVLARVSFVGYKTIYKLCETTNAGVIRIKSDTYTLKNVTVKGYKPTMKMISGGMEIDVQNTLLADAGSALDVLSQLPRVNVTSNGGVEVFGKGKPEIYINGKKMRNKGELEQLTSKDIKSVEVITMPGARYDATLGSVIRINTIKRRGDGFSLYSLARGSYFHEFANAAGVSITYRKNGLEMNFYPYFVNNYSGEDNNFGSTLHLTDHDAKTMQHGLFTDRTQSFVPDFKLSYDFDANHSIGASYRYQTTLKYDNTFHSDYSVHHNDILQGSVSQTADHNWDVTSHNANAYYIGKIGQWDINADGSFVHTTVKRGQHINEQSKEFEDRTVNTSSTQDSRLYAGKLIAAYKLPKGEVSFGTELTHSHVDADNHNPEGYIAESDNEIQESNYAGFASYGLQLGHWSLETGVRFEYVHSDYYSYGVKDADVSRRYSGFFPNLSASWNKGKWGMQFAYAKKTRRPAYGQLRSYQQYDNRYAYEGGSPDLQPAINHMLEAMLNWKWLNFSLGYTYTKDYMLWKNDIYNEQEVAYAHWINIDHKQEVSASLVLQPKFEWYQPQMEMDYYQQFFDAKRYGYVSNLRRPAFHLDLNNKFVINKSCWLALRGNYSCAHDNMSQEVDAFWYVSAHAYKSFFNGALAFNLTINDIFNTNMERWKMRTHSVEISKDCNNHSMTRGIRLQVTYDFNTTRSKYKGTGAGNAEKNRL
ncbi:CarboxypepD_reg-like domain-containing protein [Prevotella communis]|uniref:CarboxypepD_reg-like domain-containing protein n=1 Tax=Prevotella communis TaxID=2913614 RepID=A0A1H0IS16_9BACT|nr:outer membrane beta-barrel family protein [Prevotella communis]SDO34165.1 CarboxypepD_reg-like domain-containing protein [Prevotella communis]